MVAAEETGATGEEAGAELAGAELLGLDEDGAEETGATGEVEGATLVVDGVATAGVLWIVVVETEVQLGWAGAWT